MTPDAVFCSNDYMAAGAMKVLSEIKLRVPEDVVIVGYDNTDICIGLTPTLTTVAYRAEEVDATLIFRTVERFLRAIPKAMAVNPL